MFKIRFRTEGAGFSSTKKSMLCCSKSNTCLTPGFKSNKQVPDKKINKTYKTGVEVKTEVKNIQEL